MRLPHRIPELLRAAKDETDATKDDLCTIGELCGNARINAHAIHTRMIGRLQISNHPLAFEDGKPYVTATHTAALSAVWSHVDFGVHTADGIITTNDNLTATAWEGNSVLRTRCQIQLFSLLRGKMKGVIEPPGE